MLWLQGTKFGRDKATLWSALQMARARRAAEPEAGVYGVRFFKDGEWMYEVLDDSLPVSQHGRPLFSGEVSLALLEKGYAKIHGDLVSEKASRFCRPIDGMVNTSSGLPFVHKDQAVDLEELMNVFTIEIQKQPEQIHKVTRGSATSRLQLASRVPLLVKDPATDLTMQTQPLPNDVHTLRLDMNPKEVRHITCDMKSRHFKGSELEGRLMSVVHPERGVLAKMLSALQQKEREAQGLTAVLNHLLREVSKPLRPQNISSAERLDALLSEPRRTLAQLLSVSDRLAEVVQPLVASVAHAIDRMALICVREVDRLASYCDTEFDKLLKALNTSEEARIEAEDRIDKMGGTHLRSEVPSSKHYLARKEE
eukprot:g11655.t1